MVETCCAAQEESGVTFVHFNGGFQGSRGLRVIEPYVRAIKENVGLLVGVQLTPGAATSARYDRLIDLGVDHFSFCLELIDPRLVRAHLSRQGARCSASSCSSTRWTIARRGMPRGAVSGEIIAGLEPIESTLAAIERITSVGAFPTVCIFRPTVGSDMEDWPPPEYAATCAGCWRRSTTRAAAIACRSAWRPNIEVSLVVNPDDAALLAPARRRHAGLRGVAARAARGARPVFARRMRARADDIFKEE